MTLPARNAFRGVYALTDRVLSGVDHAVAVQALVKAGVRWIQFREKHWERKKVYETARALREITSRHGARLIVNDFLDIAVAIEADGVHLGQDDLPLAAARRIAPPGFIIGISTHDLEQAEKAEEDGANYIGFGPMFRTTTKAAGTPVGVKALRQVRKVVSLPIAAIGGISRETAGAVVAAGADMLAVATAIYASPPWAAAVEELQTAFAGE